MNKDKFEEYFVQFYFASIVILIALNLWIMLR